MKKNGVKITKQSLEDTMASLNLLADVEVLVGFPEETADRQPEEGEKDTGITNAALGYIHDTGMPEQNIPARPFMEPGIAEAKDRLTDKLGQVMKAASRGADAGTIEAGMHQVGFIAQNSIKRAINSGIPPPLADSTLKARARRGRKGALQELDRRWDGQEPSMEFAKPLVDTAQMREAVKYAIRSRKNRS